MKRLIVSGVVLFACVAGEAAAAPNCLGTNQVTSGLSALVTDNTACSPPSGPAPFDWQEQHVSGGVLRDYKLGQSHPVDPTVQVGTWSINTRNQIVYNYGTGGTYTYTVHSNGDGNYSFCAGSVVKVVGKFKTGLGGCP